LAFVSDFVLRASFFEFQPMYQRLTISDVAAVERGLAAGMRHAEIAREFDLSVWTIARIADRRRFKRDDESICDTNPKRKRGTDPDEDLPEDDGPPDYQARNLRRCPTCGAMIYVWPCIACCMATSVPAVISMDDDEEEEETTNDTKYTNGDRERDAAIRRARPRKTA
jgi:hypothetical protein